MTPDVVHILSVTARLEDTDALPVSPDRIAEEAGVSVEYVGDRMLTARRLGHAVYIHEAPTSARSPIRTSAGWVLTASGRAALRE